MPLTSNFFAISLGFGHHDIPEPAPGAVKAGRDGPRGLFQHLGHLLVTEPFKVAKEDKGPIRRWESQDRRFHIRGMLLGRGGQLVMP